MVGLRLWGYEILAAEEERKKQFLSLQADINRCGISLRGRGRGRLFGSFVAIARSPQGHRKW